MDSRTAGSARIFQVAGIGVYVHWSWLLIAFYEIQSRGNAYSSIAWNIAEYLTLFVIILLHEFGHALACRQVGGLADTIVLWPLGGVAYISPPRRPGAVLWSVAAGPLVNFILILPTVGAVWMAISQDLDDKHADLVTYLEAIAFINVALLVFNMLPVFPLDGGQIVMALLWFIVGEATSLLIVSVLGVISAIPLGIWAILSGKTWTTVLAAYMGYRSILGFRAARSLAAYAKLPRVEGFRCPACSDKPVDAAAWLCEECNAPMSLFSHAGICPNCHQRQSQARCLRCGQESPLDQWLEPGY